MKSKKRDMNYEVWGHPPSWHISLHISSSSPSWHISNSGRTLAKLIQMMMMMMMMMMIIMMILMMDNDDDDA